MSEASEERRSDNAARVFISHSSEDKPFAWLAVEALRKGELSPWIDSEQVLVGEDIIERIGDGLRTMDVLIAIVSKASLRSGWVAAELNFAMLRAIADKQVLLLPFIVDDVAIADLPWPLQSRRVERVTPDADGAHVIAIGVVQALKRRTNTAAILTVTKTVTTMVTISAL